MEMQVRISEYSTHEEESLSLSGETFLNPMLLILQQICYFKSAMNSVF